MATVAIICIASVVVILAVIMAVMIYNQMLLLNEVNKRLLLMAKESVDKERSTQEELSEALVALEAKVNEQAVPAQQQEEQFVDQDLEL